MFRRLRAFLVWVMVIAMPLQGMAAAAMLFCGPSHDRMLHGLQHGTAQRAPADMADHTGHGAGHAGMDHGAAGHAGTAADEPTVDASADDGPGLSPHQGQVSCSACAACCLALALPAPRLTAAAAPPDRPVSASPAEPAGSQQPDGLDRPPRALRA